MLYGATFEGEMPANLIAGRLEPLSFDLRSLRAAERARNVTTSDIAAVRQAIDEGREPSERAIDHVVDRLLKELAW